MFDQFLTRPLECAKRHTSVASAALLLTLTFASTPSALKAQFLVYYNHDNGQEAVTELGPNQTPTPVASQVLSKNWSRIVDFGGGNVFFYNKDSGLAAVTSMGRDGILSTSNVLHFSTGWTQIVYHRGYLLFYNKDTGSAVVGGFQWNGQTYAFVQFPAVYGFSPGWSSIVSSTNGLLFYNTDTGAGASGDFQFDYTGCGGGFCSPTNVLFVQKKSFLPGSFTTGWSQIVNTNNGILFYRVSDGLLAVGDLSASGDVGTRDHSVQNVGAGYTSVAVSGQTIEFYKKNTGDGAVGQILGVSKFVRSEFWGTFQITKTFPGLFSAGWTDVAAVDLPAPLH